MGYEVVSAVNLFLKNLLFAMGKGWNDPFIAIQQESKKQLRDIKQLCCPAVGSRDNCYTDLSDAAFETPP